MISIDNDDWLIEDSEEEGVALPAVLRTEVSVEMDSASRMNRDNQQRNSLAISNISSFTEPILAKSTDASAISSFTSHSMDRSSSSNAPQLNLANSTSTHPKPRPAWGNEHNSTCSDASTSADPRVLVASTSAKGVSSSTHSKPRPRPRPVWESPAHIATGTIEPIDSANPTDPNGAWGLGAAIQETYTYSASIAERAKGKGRHIKPKTSDVSSSAALEVIDITSDEDCEPPPRTRQPTNKAKHKSIPNQSKPDDYSINKTPVYSDVNHDIVSTKKIRRSIPPAVPSSSSNRPPSTISNERDASSSPPLRTIASVVDEDDFDTAMDVDAHVPRVLDSETTTSFFAESSASSSIVPKNDAIVLASEDLGKLKATKDAGKKGKKMLRGVTKLATTAKKIREDKGKGKGNNNGGRGEFKSKEFVDDSDEDAEPSTMSSAVIEVRKFRQESSRLDSPSSGREEGLAGSERKRKPDDEGTERAESKFTRIHDEEKVNVTGNKDVKVRGKGKGRGKKPRIMSEEQQKIEHGKDSIQSLDVDGHVGNGVVGKGTGSRQTETQEHNDDQVRDDRVAAEREEESKENTTPNVQGSSSKSKHNDRSSKLIESTTRIMDAQSSKSVVPSRSGKRTMADLLRKVNSMPGSPFASPAASPHYSPYLKSSRSTLTRIAPLHPNRRAPPAPPPRLPAPKKSKKQLEIEERWEEELEESVEGWVCLSEEERAALRRAKRDRELGYED